MRPQLSFMTALAAGAVALLPGTSVGQAGGGPETAPAIVICRSVADGVPQGAADQFASASKLVALVSWTGMASGAKATVAYRRGQDELGRFDIPLPAADGRMQLNLDMSPMGGFPPGEYTVVFISGDRTVAQKRFTVEGATPTGPGAQGAVITLPDGTQVPLGSQTQMTLTGPAGLTGRVDHPLPAPTGVQETGAPTPAGAPVTRGGAGPAVRELQLSPEIANDLRATQPTERFAADVPRFYVSFAYTGMPAGTTLTVRLHEPGKTQPYDVPVTTTAAEGRAACYLARRPEVPFVAGEWTVSVQSPESPRPLNARRFIVGR